MSLIERDFGLWVIFAFMIKAGNIVSSLLLGVKYEWCLMIVLNNIGFFVDSEFICIFIVMVIIFTDVIGWVCDIVERVSIFVGIDLILKGLLFVDEVLLVDGFDGLVLLQQLLHLSL